MSDDKFIKVKYKGLEEYINHYIDLLKEGYKISDIFERITERMRSEPRFTATELAVGLCIAYDEEFIIMVLRELIKFCPLVYQKLHEMGLKMRIQSSAN